MNNKAFTLAEILGVIIILSVISVIIFPIVNKVVRTNKEKLYKEQVTRVEEVAYRWTLENSEKVGYEGTNDYVLSLVDLKTYGSLKNDELISPIDNKKMMGCILIRWNTERRLFDYQYSEDKDKCNKLNDIEKPTVTILEVGSPFNASGWAKSNFNVNITVNDSNSGAKNYKWCSIKGVGCIPDTTSILPTGTVTMTEESVGSVICAIGYDIAGNQSDIVCSNAYKLDKTLPSINGLSDLVINVNGTPDLIKDVQPVDSISGIDGTFTYTPTTVNTSTNGIKTVTYKAKDKAGNEVTIVRNIKVLVGAPGASFATVGTPINSNGWAKNDFEVTISSIDYDNNGIKNIKYCLTTESTCNPTIEVSGSSVGIIINTESASNKICAIVEDNANQKSPLTCSGTYKLDKTNPTITGLTPIEVEVGYTPDLTTGVSTNDNLSGVDGTFSVGNVDTSTVGTKTATYMVNDNAGNTVTQNRIVKVIEMTFNVSKGVNRPQLTTGMTPIKWDVSNNEITTNENDSEWYDYTNKKWANAKTADGSYFVWIPRYAYKMNGEYHSNITSSFDIKFLKGNTNEPTDSTIIETSGYNADTKNTLNNYFLHPAFQNDMNEYGFWVAKFEPSVANQSDSCYTSPSTENCNKTDLTVKIIPNTSSLRYMYRGNAFLLSKNMKNKVVYGWDSSKVDTHMMTNYEWGAVTYLTHSTYGKNAEVWINPSNTFITGCAGTSVSASNSAGCSYAYNTSNGQQASTTGNTYGIYDMSGGEWESVSAYVNNGVSQLTTYGSSIINETEIKYKNVYTKGTTDNSSTNYTTNKNIYGDAIWETSNAGEGATSWNGDYSAMPSTSYPFFSRGGSYGSASGAGLFSFGNSSGDYSLFRPIVSIKP